MIKNWIIGVEAAIMLLMAAYWYGSAHVNLPVRSVHLPEVQLGERERIIQAEVIFRSASIKAIRNIPPGWDVSVDLRNPPNPVFRGSIIVGAAAVGSTAELPVFELETYVNDIQPEPKSMVLQIAAYDGTEKARKLVVPLHEP